MTLETALRWSWTDVLNKKRAYLLIGKFGDLEKALQEISIEMLRELGCREETALLVMNRLEEFDPEAHQKELKKRGLTLHSIDDETYPAALRQIGDPPMFLYSRGDLSILSQPCLAMVGAREMTDYGRRVTGALVPGLVQAGLVTVSGLAYGIDAEVAKETIAAGGRTVGVLGHGLGMIYPKANQRLADEIVKGGGLLLSEFPLDREPDKYTFPARNRIIAGLSLGTVVVEAAAESGSLITAELALEYGREVFAVPGQIFDPSMVGCHQLIARGHAKLVSSAADITQDLGLISSQRAEMASSFTPESPDEQSVFGALTTMPIDPDQLSIKTSLNAATLSAVLTILEIKGAAKNVGGGKWVRA